VGESAFNDDDMLDFDETNQVSFTPRIPNAWMRVGVCLSIYLFFRFVLLYPAALSLRRVAAQIAIALGPTANQAGPLVFSILSIHLPLVLSVLVCRRFIDRKSLGSLGLSHHPIRFVGGVIIGTILVCALVFCLLALNVSVLKDTDRMPWQGFALQLLFHLSVAISEGLLLTGYVTWNLHTTINRYAAAGISALIFAGAHLLNPNLCLPGVLSLIFMGFAMALYYSAKGDLWLPIGAHWSWNVVQGPILGFNVSGRRPQSLFAHTRIGSDLFTGGRFGFEGSIVVTLMLALITSFLVLHFIREKRRC
jgi:membrane protease YdiL (CAAX protease family)